MRPTAETTVLPLVFCYRTLSPGVFHLSHSLTQIFPLLVTGGYTDRLCHCKVSNEHRNTLAWPVAPGHLGPTSDVAVVLVKITLPSHAHVVLASAVQMLTLSKLSGKHF